MWYGLFPKQQMQWGQIWQPWYAALLTQAGLSQAPHRMRCGWRVCRDTQLVKVGPYCCNNISLRRRAGASQEPLQMAGGRCAGTLVLSVGLRCTAAALPSQRGSQPACKRCQCSPLDADAIEMHSSSRWTTTAPCSVGCWCCLLHAGALSAAVPTLAEIDKVAAPNQQHVL